MKKHDFCKTKKITFCIASIFFTFFAIAKPVDNIKQFTMENGMEVFLLEDPSDALVHIEYACRAGFSSQSQDNCGFFKLYTRLVDSNNPELNFSDVQCNQDSSRYILTVTAPQTETALIKLSNAVFNPHFSDELLSSELERLQKEVKDTTEDMSMYINSAIESKVFSDAPWKHNSGIYPPLFRKITTNEARVQIKNISENWYTPQNSALFICGNINSEKIQVLLENTFGSFYSSNKIPGKEFYKAKNNNKQRKFILHSPELSSELTQVVVQYSSLDMTEADFLAEILNNNKSTFKDKLLSFQSLNIPGDEYINVSSTQERDYSRLIFQTLIQPPANSSGNKINTNSINQTIEFYTQVLNAENLITEEEIIIAQDALISKILTNTKDVVGTMNTLSEFWAKAPYYNCSESDFANYPDSVTTSLMMSQINKILNINFNNVINNFNKEKPFVFVIINSDDYNKNKVAYSIAGFEEIKAENSSWYVQEMYKNMKEQLDIEKESQYVSDSYGYSNSKSKDNQYYERNLKQIKNYELQNGIKVIAKQNPDSSSATMLLSINGGKLKSADDNGFEEVMISILSSMIENELQSKYKNSIIQYPVAVSEETNISTSSILIEFHKNDGKEICETIKNVIVYGEIPPAMADKAVSQKRYKKRLSNGSVKNQMYGEIINQIYGQGPLYNIYEAKNEILDSTAYMSILAEYPSLLDTRRYNIILSGNFNENIITSLNNTIGSLSMPVITQNNSLSSAEGKQTEGLTPVFPANKSVTMGVIHTFLTDIPAEEAGPQPAELIPTTEFLDPVMYVIQAPEFGTKESSLFKALLKYLELELQNNINRNSQLQKCTVTITLPENKTNFATVMFMNVAHTQEIDSIFRTTISQIIDDLSIQRKKDITIQKIKDYWTLTQLKNTTTDTGTVKLLQEGFEQFPENPKPTYYLDQYNHIQTGTVRDFEKVINYLITPVSLKVYSSDSKY